MSTLEPSTTARSDSGNKNNAPSSIFQVGDRIFCFQSKAPDPTLYEAKILDIKPALNGENNEFEYYQYYVKYDKWPSKYNEWVPEGRALVRSADTIAFEKGIKVATSYDKKGPPKSGAAKRKQKVDKNGTALPQKKNQFIETVDLFEAKAEIYIPIPGQLKGALCEDWNFIVHRKEWFDIPAHHTVDSVLNDYVKHRTENPVEEINDYNSADLCLGIKEYFNRMIVTCLLYRSEEEQLYYYETQCSDEGKEFPIGNMSSVYGPRHLLRLFTKLGRSLAYTGLDLEAINLLLKCLADFLKFLEDNFTEYFPYSDFAIPQNDPDPEPGAPEAPGVSGVATPAAAPEDTNVVGTDTVSPADAATPDPAIATSTSVPAVQMEGTPVLAVQTGVTPVSTVQVEGTPVPAVQTEVTPVSAVQIIGTPVSAVKTEGNAAVEVDAESV